MAVVAGVIFFIVRAFFALIPGLAGRAPIKKWAALAVLLVTGFYLILSGNQVATQRSFIMIGVVLLGVLFDRPALTIAALVVLLFAPESIVHPSFQMSFAATLALIAGYERGAIKLRGRADSSLGARAALWGANEIVGLTIASLLAGLATTPYAAFHFHRVTPYGVLANLLAMPIVSAWVMPMGILGILTMPFGLDAEFWRQMGYGIEWMNAVGLWVASLPRRLRPRELVRDRSAVVGHGRFSGHRPVENAAALERVGGSGGRCDLGRVHGAPGRADRRRRTRLRGSRQ
jgi:competence protein ComEC